MFPFDEQNCYLIFSSAHYHRQELEIGHAYGPEIYIDPGGTLLIVFA